MTKLELPILAPVHMDEKGRISCGQASETNRSGIVENDGELHIVMATLCHMQCDSKAS